MSKLLLRVDEAASALSWSRSSTYEAIRRGEIPVVRLNGHSIRVPLEALERLIRDKTAADGDAER